MIAGIASAMLIILTAAPAYASMLKGVVVANKLAGGGLDNVEVTVDEAAGNSTITKDGGKFAFAFPEKHAGEIVHVRVSLKEGYAIVNDFQLECTILADPDAKLLTIIVCREVDREELARFFYRLKSDEAIEATYQKKLKALEEAHQTDLEAAAKLKEERDQAKAAAEKYSLELAKDQPGRSSELYQQARRLFVEGKIDEAIALLDENKLRQLDEEAKKAVENAVQPRLLKAHLLTVQFRFDEAETAFIQAIAISPDGFEANFAYAGFTQNLNRFDKSRTAYSRCLEWARENRKDAELAATLNNLGAVDWNEHRTGNAREEYAEALQIYRELVQRKRETYLAAFAVALNNLGLLDRDQHRIQEARDELAEALQIRRELAQKNLETYQPDIAQTLNNLGILDRDQHRIEEAGNELAEALQIRRELALKDQATYKNYVARSLNNLGMLNRDRHRAVEARNELAEALQIRRELAQKNLETYKPDLRNTLNNLGELDRDQHRTQDACNELGEALQIRRELVQKNPEAYRPDLAETLNAIGILDRDRNRSEDASVEFADALQIRRELALKNPKAYRPDVAKTLNDLGILDRDRDRTTEARAEFVEALQIYAVFAEQEPERFSADVTRVKGLLAKLPNTQGK